MTTEEPIPETNTDEPEETTAVIEAIPTPVVPSEPESKKRWYVVKVATAREESIKAAILRKIKIEGLEEYFGQIVIPVERITEVKKTKETKKDGEKITKEKRV